MSTTSIKYDCSVMMQKFPNIVRLAAYLESNNIHTDSCDDGLSGRCSCVQGSTINRFTPAEHLLINSFRVELGKVQPITDWFVALPDSKEEN